MNLVLQVRLQLRLVEGLRGEAQLLAGIQVGIAASGAEAAGAVPAGPVPGFSEDNGPLTGTQGRRSGVRLFTGSSGRPERGTQDRSASTAIASVRCATSGGSTAITISWTGFVR